MPKKTNIGDELVASMAQVVDIIDGKLEPGRVWLPPGSVDVRKIRDGLGLSQAAFADRFGFSVSAVREWEYGRRKPEGAARTLLSMIEREPETVMRLLQPAA